MLKQFQLVSLTNKQPYACLMGTSSLGMFGANGTQHLLLLHRHLDAIRCSMETLLKTATRLAGLAVVGGVFSEFCLYDGERTTENV